VFCCCLNPLFYVFRELPNFATQLLGYTLRDEPTALMITKPPESVLVAAHKLPDRPNSVRFVLFDSHPRPERELPGSHMLEFDSVQNLIRYLALLFPDAGLSRDDYQVWRPNCCICLFLKFGISACLSLSHCR
jgi:hypothetical protein